MERSNSLLRQGTDGGRRGSDASQPARPHPGRRRSRAWRGSWRSTRPWCIDLPASRFAGCRCRRFDSGSPARPGPRANRLEYDPNRGSFAAGCSLWFATSSTTIVCAEASSTRHGQQRRCKHCSNSNPHPRRNRSGRKTTSNASFTTPRSRSRATLSHPPGKPSGGRPLEGKSGKETGESWGSPSPQSHLCQKPGDGAAEKGDSAAPGRGRITVHPISPLGRGVEVRALRFPGWRCSRPIPYRTPSPPAPLPSGEGVNITRKDTARNNAMVAHHDVPRSDRLPELLRGALSREEQSTLSGHLGPAIPASRRWRT